MENIAYYFTIPGGELSEAEFFAHLVEKADCRILLDLNNLYVNSKNFGYDPYEFLNALPLERVVEIHIAGGALQNGLYVDTHGHAVGEEVWTYLQFVCDRSPVRAILLERDQALPPFEEIVNEVCQAREIFQTSRSWL